MCSQTEIFALAEATAVCLKICYVSLLRSGIIFIPWGTFDFLGREVQLVWHIFS